MSVEVELKGVSDEPFRNANEIIVSSGIAMNAFGAFMKDDFYKIFRYPPNPDLKISDCYFRIVYDCGAALDEDPSSYGVVIHYPDKDGCWQSSLRMAVCNPEDSKNFVKLSAAQQKLVDYLVCVDFALHKESARVIVGACVDYLNSGGCRDGINWVSHEHKWRQRDLIDKVAFNVEVEQLLSECNPNLCNWSKDGLILSLNYFGANT